MKLHEGIENVAAQTAAESQPFQLKKYIVSQLNKRGIKINKKRTMEKKTSFRSGNYYNVNFFENFVMFETHPSHFDEKLYIKLRFVGNKIVVKLELNNNKRIFTTPLGQKTSKNLIDFISESYYQSIENFSQNSNKFKPLSDVVKEIDDGLGKQYSLSQNSFGSKNQILFRIHVYEFDFQQPPKNKILSVTQKLLNDPVVKRNLDKDKKSISERHVNFQSPIAELITQKKDEIFTMIENTIESLYNENIKISRTTLEDNRIELIIYKPSESRKGKVKNSPMPKKDVVLSIKKQLIEYRSKKKQEQQIYYDALKGVAKPAIKRFFKEPEKYL
jgi:hypothetical protein